MVLLNGLFVSLFVCFVLSLASLLIIYRVLPCLLSSGETSVPVLGFIVHSILLLIGIYGNTFISVFMTFYAGYHFQPTFHLLKFCCSLTLL